MQYKTYRSQRSYESRSYARIPNEPRGAPKVLGRLLETLRLGQLRHECHAGDAGIGNFRFVASYNLLEGMNRTIIVPGCPALWTPPAGSQRLRPDTGEYYQDENAARFGVTHFDPTVAAVLHMERKFDPTAIDVVACASTLGHLLRFVRGESRPFSMTAHRIGDAVFFSRREGSPRELIEDVHGFGNRFVETNTTWDQELRDSASHQRIVSYTIGKEKLLVRFEVDTYIGRPRVGGVSRAVPPCPEQGGFSLADSFQALTSRVDDLESSGPMQIIEKGRTVAQDSIADIKTRSFRKDRATVMAEQLPRLWLRQTQNVVLSFHNKGLFPPAETEDVSVKLAEWEKKHKNDIAILASLIGTIKQRTSAILSKKLEIRYEQGDELTLHELSPEEQKNWDPLSEDLRARWLSSSNERRTDASDTDTASSRGDGDLAG